MSGTWYIFFLSYLTLNTHSYQVSIYKVHPTPLGFYKSEPEPIDRNLRRMLEMRISDKGDVAICFIDRVYLYKEGYVSRSLGSDWLTYLTVVFTMLSQYHWLGSRLMQMHGNRLLSRLPLFGYLDGPLEKTCGRCGTPALLLRASVSRPLLIQSP
jgi:hypothetical protein